MSAAAYYGRGADPRLARRELSRRLARATEPERCGCGCGCSERDRGPAPPAGRAAVCGASVCVEELAGRLHVHGLAHRYGVWSNTLVDQASDAAGRAFREIIEPGAFGPALARRELDIAVTVNHDTRQVLGRYQGRPTDDARVWSTRTGLHFRLTLPDDPLGHLVAEDLQAGILRGTSFVMADVRATWTVSADGEHLRRIRSVGELLDVALVRFPAYSFAPPDPVEAVA